MEGARLGGAALAGGDLTSLLTYCGAATTPRPLPGAPGGTRASSVRGPSLACGVAAGRVWEAAKTPGHWESPPLCTQHAFLLEGLPQHLLAVNGAPAGEDSTVTLGLPAPRGVWVGQWLQAPHPRLPHPGGVGRGGSELQALTPRPPPHFGGMGWGAVSSRPPPQAFPAPWGPPRMPGAWGRDSELQAPRPQASPALWGRGVGAVSSRPISSPTGLVLCRTGA